MPPTHQANIRITTVMQHVSNKIQTANFSPFDCAFEVGLADGAVVYEDGGAGAVLLRQRPRRHLEMWRTHT